MEPQLPHLGDGALHLPGPVHLEHLLVLQVGIACLVVLFLQLLLPTEVDVEHVVQVLEYLLVGVEECYLRVGVGVLVFVVDALLAQ